MQIFLGLSFIFVIMALLIGFKATSADIEKLLKALSGRQSLKQMAKAKAHHKNIIKSTKAMMEATGQENKFYLLIALSLFLLVIGITAGISFNNFFLSPVLALGFAGIPFIYMRFQNVKYKKLIVEELETSLSTVSISYERSENILLAFEENIENVNEPIKKVFGEFVYAVRYVNPNIESAIDDMKGKINHSVFTEWCDALKRCVRNRSLKYTLRPIIDKLTEIKIVSNDLKNILYQANRTFWQMLVLTIILLYVGIVVVPQGMGMTVPRSLSNALVAVNAALIVMATIKVLFEINDIEFDI